VGSAQREGHFAARAPAAELRVTSAAMHRIVIVLAVLALGLAPAGLAQAQFGAPNAPSPLTQPPPPPPVDNDLGDEGLSVLQQVLIFGAAALVLALIAFVIVRDAHKAAPVDKNKAKRKGSRPSAGGTSASRPAGSRKAAVAPGPAASDTSASAERARERQRAKREKAKAKAVREQRKRNRPR
jgi:hypothetical protein